MILYSLMTSCSTHPKVLENEFCSGYIDSFGKWNTGFYCPQIESTTAVYCCGTPTFKYCCTIRQGGDISEEEISEDTPTLFVRTAVMVGIIAGITLVLLLITIASCFFCSCCFVYKKRRAHLNGGLYRMQCSSTADGLLCSPSAVSNQHSCVTTPMDIMECELHHYHEHINDPMFIDQNEGHLLPPAPPPRPIGNGYPPELQTDSISFIPASNNQSLATLPRYHRVSPVPHDNLPPPVFYPENHFRHSGTAYSLTSGTTSSCSTQNRPHSQYNNNQASLGFSTVSRPQNNFQSQASRAPQSILRNSFSRALNGNINNPGNYTGNNNYRPNSEIMGNGGGNINGIQVFSTLPRLTAGYQLTDGRNRNGRGSIESGSATPSIQSVCQQPLPEGHVERLLVNGAAVLGQNCNNIDRTNSNTNRLAVCLSDDDDINDTLSSSAL